MIFEFLILFVCVIIILTIFSCLCSTNKSNEYFTNLTDLPIIIIAYNNLTFVKNFINQLLHLPNPIIIVDNNSSYQPLLQFYDEIEKSTNQKVKVMKLRKNYGHRVYLSKRKLFPQIYILSDPDLELNKNMPNNVSSILYDLSEEYKKFKVGLCLDISDSHLFFPTKNYMGRKDMSIEKWEEKFWKNKIENSRYELYDAPIDTTFTLVNWKYYNKNEYNAIRIGGEFTAKHLPWYDQYIQNNLEKEELEKMKIGDRSSSILKVLEQYE